MNRAELEAELEQTKHELAITELNEKSAMQKVAELEAEIVKLNNQNAMLLQSAHKDFSVVSETLSNFQKKTIELTNENQKLQELLEAHKRQENVPQADLREIKRVLRNRIYAKIEEVFKGE